MKDSKSVRLAISLATAVGATALVPGAHAAANWGSIHGNNREENRQEREEHSRRVTAPPVSGRREIPSPRSPVEPNRGRPAGVFNGREREGEAFRPERGGEAERHERLEDSVRERRRWDIDGERSHSYFWFGYHPGMFINTLPPDYSQIYVGGNPYYYDQGVYYQTGPSGYVVVTPPLGAIVPQLPPGAAPIPYGPTVYYYAAGAFYVQQPQGFTVVAPPPGIAITELPPNAQPVSINGMLYYQANGLYFLPEMQNGVTVYVTAQP